MECKIRDITMQYDEAGSGKPLLVLDGWGYSGLVTKMGFEPRLEARSGWRRLYPALPGHGRTPMPDWLQSPDDMLDVLLEFMEAVAPGERFAVVGASWGAYIALGLLHRRKDQLDGVMLDIPGIKNAFDDLPPKTVVRQDPAFAASLQAGEEWMQYILVVQTKEMVEDIRALMAYSTPNDPEFAARLRGKPLSFDAHILPEPFQAPALFITGRQDHLAGYKDSWSILERFPRATFAVLDRAGHLLDLEQPRLANALTNEWLDRVEEYISQKSQAPVLNPQDQATAEVHVSPDEIVRALPAHLVVENAAGLEVTYQFDLSGDAGGKWWVKIQDGKAESGKGESASAANVTLLAEASDWVRIMTGRVDAMTAFMQGKLRLNGDRQLALKFITLFKVPAEDEMLVKT
jgi:pimeloyl-ACP methyl ester carboxylesterase/putative sterol carrier protein